MSLRGVPTLRRDDEAISRLLRSPSTSLGIARNDTLGWWFLAMATSGGPLAQSHETGRVHKGTCPKKGVDNVYDVLNRSDESSGRRS